MATFDFSTKQKMATLLEVYKVFVNHLYKALVVQDDVNNIRKIAESLIIELGQAKLEESCVQASERNFARSTSSLERNFAGGANFLEHNSVQNCVSDSKHEPKNSRVLTFKLVSHLPDTRLPTPGSEPRQKPQGRVNC